jgi:hypothetical protein
MMNPQEMTMTDRQHEDPDPTQPLLARGALLINAHLPAFRVAVEMADADVFEMLVDDLLADVPAAGLGDAGHEIGLVLKLFLCDQPWFATADMPVFLALIDAAFEMPWGMTGTPTDVTVKTGQSFDRR